MNIKLINTFIKQKIIQKWNGQWLNINYLQNKIDEIIEFRIKSSF